MATGDIDYGAENNEKIFIEDQNGERQKAVLVGTPNGFNGPTSVQSTPFELAVKQGRVANYSTISKFGSNAEIEILTTPEDVWEGGGEYIYDTNGTAPIVSLISDDASDTQAIEIIGLDIDGNEVTQEITLNGTTRVALTTPLWRVYRMNNNGDTDIAGTVYCYTGTGGVPTSTELRALITDGNNQTLMVEYTVPLGKVGFIYRGEAGIKFEGVAAAAADYARVFYTARLAGKVFRISKEVTLQTNGNSTYQDNRPFPDPLPALTDITISVAEVSTTMGIWATFDIMLIDESEFTEAYLTAIGQPSEVPT